LLLLRFTGDLAWVEDGGVFERRGREGFAKGAKEDKEKIKPKKELNLKTRSSATFKEWACLLHFLYFLYFLYFLFCVLCETFAPSAFKKSPS
jgi:hypothetical protein